MKTVLSYHLQNVSTDATLSLERREWYGTQSWTGKRIKISDRYSII